MTQYSKEEYLKILEQLVSQQYGDEESDYNLPEADHWIPAESPYKEKIKLPGHDGITDLTNIKSNKIKDLLHACRNIRVGKFLIKISRYHGEPDYDGNVNVGMDVCIYEERSQTESGHPGKLQYKLDLHKDDRFQGRPWVANFNSVKIGTNITMETMVDIIRWLQAITNLTCFL